MVYMVQYYIPINEIKENKSKHFWEKIEEENQQ